MDYWIDRNLRTQEALTEKNIKATEKQLAKYYRKAMLKILGQFKLIHMAVFSKISEGKNPTPADLYKLDAYWQMQGQLRDELQKLGDMESVLLSKQFVDQYLSIYNSLAIPGQEHFTQVDAAAATQLINQIWCADGRSWSQRIWQNTDLLQEALNEHLVSSIVAGRKTSELLNLLQEQFAVSYNRADALVRTEMAHIQTQAAQKRYIDYGMKEVEVWASKDERRCEVCGKLHEKRFPIGAKMPVPAHPRCRCTIIPVIE